VDDKDGTGMWSVKMRMTWYRHAGSYRLSGQIAGRKTGNECMMIDMKSLVWSRKILIIKNGEV